MLTVPNPAPVEGESHTAKPEPPPATEKQKDFARELGIEFPGDIDRKEISALIDDALARQDDARFERLNALQEKESQVREELRAEVLAECDEEDPRLSIASEEQILEALADRDLGAILITFEYGILGGVDDLTGEKFTLASTDDIDNEDLKTIVSWLGIAVGIRGSFDANDS